jgi:Rps23 Pro-64 3,4-dihydroxylase Tpa1-like proline 4-hydroxylase
MTIQANDSINVLALKNEFIENSIVRISDFLTSTSIVQLQTSVETKIEYGNAFYLDNQYRQVSDSEIKNLPVASQQQLYRDIHQIAARGEGFLYGRHKIDKNSIVELKDTLKLINTESILNLIREITKQPALQYADGQATRYRRGDFLTRHIDNVPGETRQIAYVLGLTEAWHPDWGGLLQFFDKNGTPEKSWSPTFNSLTLFDVDKVHSVTSVAPFALKNRHSITGWFRS